MTPVPGSALPLESLPTSENLPPSENLLPPDNHVHTHFSWDCGPDSTMRAACAEAVAIGLPAVAFTEHLDFTSWAPGDHPLTAHGRPRHPGRYAPLDVGAYLEQVQRCREEFPSLRVRTGIETGEPHLFAGSVAAVLAELAPERVLGSLHSVVRSGELVGVNRVLWTEDPHAVVREYFADLLAMVRASDVFEVLAHCDFPRRYWPTGGQEGYQEKDFEQEYRAVFTELAGSGRVLEVNTSSPLASVELVRWWRECGGRAVSFGSDAHRPANVGQRFDLAVDVVADAGFRMGADPIDFARC